MTKRPFRILGIQQIALGNASLAPLRHLWTELLGVPVTGYFESARENVREHMLTLPDGVRIDLMEPIDPERSPRVHLPALNHVGLWVDDLRALKSWLEEKGVRIAPGGIRPGADNHDVFFIHPRRDERTKHDGLGVLIEFIQAPPSIIARFS